MVKTKTNNKRITKSVKVSKNKKFEVKVGDNYKFEILDDKKEVIDSGTVTVLEYYSDIDKYWTVDKKGWKRFLYASEFVEQVK